MKKITELLSQQEKDNLLFYVATPYSKWPEQSDGSNPLDAAAKAIDSVAAELLSSGMMIYSPITQGHALTKRSEKLTQLAKDHNFWMRADKPLFDACDAMLVICFDGWGDSRGVNAEISWAVNQELPLIFLTPQLTPIAGFTSGNVKDCVSSVVPDEVVTEYGFLNMGILAFDVACIKDFVSHLIAKRRRDDIAMVSGSRLAECGYLSGDVIVTGKAQKQCHGTFKESPDTVAFERNPKDIAGSVKPNVALNPFPAACEQALSHELGASKYGVANWRLQPITLMTYMSAAKRHIDLFVDGEVMDPDGKFEVVTGGKVVQKQTTNLGAAMASIAIAIDAMHNGTAIDDRPKRGIGSDLYKSLGRDNT